MKYKVSVLSIGLFLLFISSNAFATVGGSSTLYSFKYNSVDESIYYIKADGGGRGCPPVLEKVSLETGVVETVFSCEDGEKLSNYDWDNRNLVNQKITEITKEFKDLRQINLKRNNFSIDVNYLKDEYMGEEEKFLIKRIFTADIYQDGKLIDQKEISACNLEEPFLFDGYSIPGFEKKIMLLMSAKEDCFEGGYISDSLYIIGGVNNLDKNTYNSNYKWSSPIQPSENTLIVYESDVVEEKPIDNEDVGVEEYSNNEYDPKTLIIGIMTFALGLILGILFSKKRTDS